MSAPGARALLTARSACAAWGVAEIWKRARRDPAIEVSVVAQEPAATILRHEDVTFRSLDLPIATKSDCHAAALLTTARKIVREFRPTVVLSGLSAPGEGGIDEATVAVATCPKFVLQDFWGDGNLFFDAHPDCYLAADDAGARATLRRQGVQSVVLGSPRHAKYAATDFEALRLETLERYGLDPAADLYGFFDQPLIQLPGYSETVATWAQAVSALDGAAVTLYRPHPSSGPAQRRTVVSLIESRGLDVTIVEGGAIERAIAVCTTMASAMSNANVDAAYVNYFASTPKAAPLYLLIADDVVDYMREFQDVESIPTVDGDLAWRVGPDDNLAEMLAAARNPRSRESFWRAAQTLPDPAHAADLAVSILKKPEHWL